MAISLGISKVGKNRDLKKIKLKNQIFDLSDTDGLFLSASLYVSKRGVY